MRKPDMNDWNRLKHAPLTPIMVSGFDMMALLSVIQLALRHPKLNGPSAQVARVFADELEKRIVEASPNLKELCAWGWNPKHDVG